MKKEHKYRVRSRTSGQTGIAKSDSAPNTIHFTAPPKFGGLEGRWTPEDLLMTSLASCFYDDVPRHRGMREIRNYPPGRGNGRKPSVNGHWLLLQRDCHSSEPDDS